MIECTLSWIFLIKGIFSNDSIWFVISGLFAIATNIYLFNRDSNNK